jgi:ubiquitin-conjugating enzyme E2 O
MLSKYIKDAGDYVAAHGQEPPARRPLTGSALSEIDWYGEVRDLRLDGRVDVVLPDKGIVTVSLDRLVVFDDLLGDDHLAPGDPFDDDGDVKMDGTTGDLGSDASWETDEGPDEWIDAGTEESGVKVDEIRLNGKPSVPEHDIAPVPSNPAPQLQNEEGRSGAAQTVEMVAVEVPGGSLAVAKGKDEEDGPWKRFEILEVAPAVSATVSSDT